MKIKFLNDSIFAIFIGVIGGFLLTKFNLQIYAQDLTKSYVKIFIVFLLPWIIFER